MNLEGIALYALTDYLKREITGSRIYKIGMPSAHVVYFSLKREYDTIHLIMDVNGGSPSVRIAAAAPGNPQEPPAFCMLLRKHLEEGKITQVRQYGLDRVIELEISLLGRTGRIIIKQIIIELTGKNANLVFAEDGKILDSLKHINPLMNSVRVIQPGYAYNPPPPQTGLNILTAVPDEIVEAIPDEVTSSLWIMEAAGKRDYRYWQSFGFTVVVRRQDPVKCHLPDTDGPEPSGFRHNGFTGKRDSKPCRAAGHSPHYRKQSVPDRLPLPRCVYPGRLPPGNVPRHE